MYNYIKTLHKNLEELQVLINASRKLCDEVQKKSDSLENENIKAKKYIATLSEHIKDLELHINIAGERR